MKQKLHKIHIIPGRFIEKRDNKYVIRCCIQKDYLEDRLFDEYSLNGMENPNLILIGIMTGVGFSQINFCQADEFEDLFKKKWKNLLK